MAAGAPFPLLTYTEVFPYLERIEIRVFESEDMPPGGLRVQESKELLSKWLEQGAFFDEKGYGDFDGDIIGGEQNKGGEEQRENVGGNVGGNMGENMGGNMGGELVPLLPTWTDVIKEKFDIYCNTCHASPPTGGAPFSLLTYDQAYPFLDRFRIRVLERKDMPPGGIQDEKDLELIREWIDLGGPQ